MQKKIIALAVAGLVSSAAFAQSNVTIYGIVDMAAMRTDVDGAKEARFGIDAGKQSGSRLGFKGVEDLGGGLKAVFNIEFGSLALDLAANNVGNTRQSYIGLTGDFGTAVAGRLQTAGYDFSNAIGAMSGSVFDPMQNVGAFTLVNIGSRADNAVAYISPSFSGLTFAVNHARLTELFAEDNVATLLSAKYATGPIAAELVYSKLDVAAKNGDVDEWALRGSYNFGAATLFGAYQVEDKDNGRDDDKWTLGVTVPVGAFGITAQYASLDRDGGNDSDSYALFATYDLSKRTNLYGGVSQVNVDRGNDTTQFGLGVRHKF